MVPGDLAGAGDDGHPLLLRAGEWSRWYRVDATEIWHFYAGDPLGLAPQGWDPGP